MGRSLPAGLLGQRWLAEQAAGRALGGLVAVLQLTRAAVPVRQPTDPAAVKMSETASSGIGGSEVDADVVQIQAPPDIGSNVHRAPPLYDILAGPVSASS